MIERNFEYSRNKATHAGDKIRRWRTKSEEEEEEEERTGIKARG